VPAEFDVLGNNDDDFCGEIVKSGHGPGVKSSTGCNVPRIV
jgi:hypothetical protein